MELRAGYKQTEIGVIPKDWILDEFKHFISNKRGGASIKPHEFKSKGVQVIPKAGVVRGGYLKIKKKDIQYCSESFFDTHKNNSVSPKY